LSRVDRVIFDEYRPATEGLGFYRVLFPAWVLLGVLPRFDWIPLFPDALFYPPLGPALLFDGFPPGWFFLGIEYVIVLAALCIAANVRARAASLAMAVAFVTGNLWAYSLGKINHDILLVVVPAVLAFSGWEKRPAERERRPGWPMALLALLIALAMLTAALAKAFSGWLDPHAPATLGHILRNHYVGERHTFVSEILVQTGNLFFWKQLDYSTLVIEAGFLVAWFSLRLFRITCAVACLFHVGVLLAMDIAFTPNVVAYAAFVNWRYVGERVGADGWLERLDRASTRVRLWHLALAAAPLVALFEAFGNPIAPVLDPLLIGVGAVFAVLYLLTCVRDLRPGSRPG
jgi:hypothetical protein